MSFERAPQQEPVPENVAELETENAHYDIIYDVHGVGEVKEDAFRNSDAIIFEGIGGVDFPGAYVEKEPSFREVILHAIKEKKPVYFVDLSFGLHQELGLDEEKLLTHFTLPILEGLAGLVFTVSAVTDVLKRNPEMSRRSFLKFLGKGAAGAYLSLPALREVTGYVSTDFAEKPPDESDPVRQAHKLLRKVSDATHPEDRTVLIHTRNDLMAQKSETIARALRAELGNKPNLGIMVGANHSGIENVLQDDERERVERLIDDLGKDLVYERYITRIDFEETKNGEIKFRSTLLEDPAIKAGLEERALKDPEIKAELELQRKILESMGRE